MRLDRTAEEQTMKEKKSANVSSIITPSVFRLKSKHIKLAQCSPGGSDGRNSFDLNKNPRGTVFITDEA